MLKFNMKTLVVAAAFFIAGSGQSFAQDNLVRALQNNRSDSSKFGFKFTEVINLQNTSVKNQGSSGTCWSYSGNSFLESEMIRNGREPVEISQLFTARNVYIEKGKNYVRLHGGLSLGEGGQLHDVINMYRKYGAVPRDVYTGLNYGTEGNKLAEMSAMTDAILAAVVKNPNGKLTPNWISAYTNTIDTYLGKVPETFNYKGKSYTPKSFAKEVIGLNADDYIELSSFKDHPYYSKFTLLIPDNWSFDQVYNVSMTDITAIIDHALKNGYTVGWATDVSEKGFSWKNGVAYVPEEAYEKMTEEEKATMFNGPKPELAITEDLRQQAFDDYSTTDDHGMHIVGLAKDQNGKEYYIVKNSWGVSNDYNGYLYVTKAFVQFKTTAFMLHKGGLPKDIAKKLGL
ncbi:aminopeptidase [Olivibacter sp. LS-1]|jgi:bleomycin hydrolase|uniref:aminopeptidase C n=1 Tax=Olivibacter sp. LS-1 TaxID=2592345 RepID=UPI0011EB82B4|nr:C1 family peptidase [Olivibacter sp. LS-1]QEL03646.1 aminopeptidase [Olivibacter sp. LS-1]